MRSQKDKPIKLPLTEPPPPDALWEAKINEAVSKALQSFYPRMSTLDNYSKQLVDVDKQVTNLVQRTLTQTTVSYWAAFSLYVMSFIVALVLLGFGLYFTLLQDQDTVAYLCIGGGLITLILVLSRNPLKNLRYLMSNMIKMNVVFSGYIRQVHQVDLVFKNFFVEKGDVPPEVLEELFNYLQDAVDEAMNAISQVSSSIDE